VHELEAEAGDTIIHEGDHGELVYLVARGRLQVHAADCPVATLGPGDHAGEIALLRGVRRTATIVALEPVELYALPREDFLAAVASHEASTRVARELVAMRLAGLENALRRPPSPPPADRTARAAG
jgi:CRP-like cAMP-binding protein